MSWANLGSRLYKRQGVQNEVDAFVWLRSFAENPDLEELPAQAFDMGLQKLKVLHLDRRILWSEIDQNAKGAISFDEFKGKLNFPLEGITSITSPESPTSPKTPFRDSSQNFSLYGSEVPSPSTSRTPVGHHDSFAMGRQLSPDSRSVQLEQGIERAVGLLLERNNRLQSDLDTNRRVIEELQRLRFPNEGRLDP